MTNSSSTSFLKSVFFLLSFYTFCLFCFWLLELFDIDKNIFLEKNFLNWDAMHYSLIMQNGYQNENVAFFPLFPFIWKFFHTGAITMAVVNGLIFIFSLAWLSIEFKISNRNLLLLASIPGMTFMFLPFSEAMFFLTSTIALIGYKKNKIWLMTAGIFLSGLSRPVATIVIPSIFLIEFLSENKLKSSLNKILILSLSCILSLVIVFILQYFQTGEWFSFFRVQREWGNYFRWPSFPLGAWAGGFMVRLDSIALFTGTASFIFLIYLIQKRLKGEIKIRDKSLIFSICYLAFMCFIILFTRGGIMNSLNRYIFSTSFFVIVLNELLKSKLFNLKNLFVIFIATTIFWFLFASYVHIQYFLKFEFLTLYLVLILLNTSEKRVLNTIGFFSFLILNTSFLIILYHRFLSGEWVG